MYVYTFLFADTKIEGEAYLEDINGLLNSSLGGTFDNWTTISADGGLVVEGPSWLSTNQEFESHGGRS